MQAAETNGRDGRVPRLVPDWQAKGDQLSPEEGFLISRIDGTTPWEVLRNIGGLPPERADLCLERWVAEGLVVLANGSTGATASPKSSAPGAPPFDPELDLSEELQGRIFVFEQRLERPYHEILGVGRDADERDIKRAYFKLSRDYHPDRYFRKQIGPFAERLDRIFKKVVIAYELLMDPATRAEVQRSLEARPPPAPAPKVGQPPPRKFTKQEWLARMRGKFRIPDSILAERRLKARQFADAARVAKHQCRWNEAASSIRLAIAFDPWNEDHKLAFAEVQAEVNQIRAARLLEEAGGASDSRSAIEALRLYEEALAYRPSDPEIHDRAAQVALEAEERERAREYAEAACELAPDVAGYQLTLGRVLRREGLRDRARTVLEQARKLDPEDSRIQEELGRVRKRPTPRSGGRQ